MVSEVRRDQLRARVTQLPLKGSSVANGPTDHPFASNSPPVRPPPRAGQRPRHRDLGAGRRQRRRYSHSAIAKVARTVRRRCLMASSFVVMGKRRRWTGDGGPALCGPQALAGKCSWWRIGAMRTRARPVPPIAMSRAAPDRAIGSARTASSLITVVRTTVGAGVEGAATRAARAGALVGRAGRSPRRAARPGRSAAPRAGGERRVRRYGRTWRASSRQWDGADGRTLRPAAGAPPRTSPPRSVQSATAAEAERATARAAATPRGRAR